MSEEIDWNLYMSFDRSNSTELSQQERINFKTKSQALSVVLKVRLISLIFHHYLATECDFDVSRLNPTKLPYEMRTKDNNIQFYLEKLPVPLQRILLRFVDVL